MRRREPRRTILAREWSGYKTQIELRLSCGHSIYVNMGSRYEHAKAAGCPTCLKDLEPPS